MSINFTKKEVTRHEIINIISRNQAMVYLKDKSGSDADRDSRIMIANALESDDISLEVSVELLKIVDNIFGEFK